MSAETCPITVHPAIPPAYNGGNGLRLTKERRCGEPVERDGLCAKHAADKERLS